MELTSERHDVEGSIELESLSLYLASSFFFAGFPFLSISHDFLIDRVASRISLPGDGKENFAKKKERKNRISRKQELGEEVANTAALLTNVFTRILLTVDPLMISNAYTCEKVQGNCFVVFPAFETMVGRIFEVHNES